MNCKRPYVIENRFFACGRCLQCRIRRRTAWTLRMLHEASTADDSLFVTLTYRDDQLMMRNGVPNLVPSDLRKFWKRLRINLERTMIKRDIKYYACGEYGDETQRPHYHAILYGLSHPRSEEFIEETWSHGRVHVGTVSADSIRYVAQYIDKKLLGNASYFSDREQPFQVSSQGIGLSWLETNLEKVLYECSLLFKGKKYPLPKAYRKHIARLFPAAAEGVSDRMIENATIAQCDFILTLAPHFGGESYDRLSFFQKCELADLIRDNGVLIEKDLQAGMSFKKRVKGSKNNVV